MTNYMLMVRLLVVVLAHKVQRAHKVHLEVPKAIQVRKVPKAEQELEGYSGRNWV
jgi:hypothetical protein